MFEYPKVRFVPAGLACAVLVFCWGCQKSSNAVDLYLDGVLLTEYDKDQEAVEKLNQAVKADKDFVYAHSVLGQVYEKMEDYNNSVASYEKATEINPESLRDFLNLGRVYRIM